MSIGTAIFYIGCFIVVVLLVVLILGGLWSMFIGDEDDGV